MKNQLCLWLVVLCSLFHSEQGLAQNDSARFLNLTPRVIDAAAFDAIASDGVDDSDELNAAIEAAAVDGGVVELDVGQYDVSETVILRANVWVRGKGSSTVIKLADNAQSTLTNFTTDLSVPIDYKPILVPSQTGGPHAGIVISDLTIDGNGDNQTDGWSYCNIATTNSVGMVVSRVRSVDAAPKLNVVNLSITSANWTDSTKTLTDVGSFTNATVNQRIRFTSGTGVTTGTDFVIATVVSADAVTLTADINGAGGNIGDSSINGAGVSSRAFCLFGYGNNATGKTCSYLKVVDSYFDRAGYDCVGVRGIGCTDSTFQNCTILRGQQYSFQAYDRAPRTSLIACTIDNTAETVGTVRGAITGHASHGLRVIGGSAKCDGASNVVNLFGDNNSGYSAAAPNNCQDTLIQGVFLEYSGTGGGLGIADFNGAGAGYQYSLRHTFDSCQISITDSTATHAAFTTGTSFTGGLTVSNCDMVSASNEALFIIGQSKNIRIANNRVRNTYSGGFAAGRTISFNGSTATNPMAISITNNYLSNNDADSPNVTITGVNGINFSYNHVVFEGSSTPSGIPLTLDNVDESNVSYNDIQAGTSGTACINVISTSDTTRGLNLTYNRVRHGPSQATEPVRGIAMDADATYTNVEGNDLSRCTTSAWGATFFAGTNTGCKVRNNLTSVSGDATENKLTGALSGGAATPSHNIKAWRTLTPGDVVVHSNSSAIRCTAVSSTTVTLAGTGTDTYYVTIRANEY